VKRITKIPGFPSRAEAGHKGSFGTLTVLAGSAGMLGAAILTARGALRGGVGLCRVCLPADLMAPFTVAVPAATTLKRVDSLRGFLEGATAMVLGPGLGSSKAGGVQVRRAIATAAVPSVLDADALNLLAPLKSRPWSGRSQSVLTPHPGEAARLLGSSSAAIQEDRRAAVEELSARTGQIAVLKGKGTLVCDGSRMFHNRSGNDGMATGGSGDVLAGLIGALLAQGMEPFEAACLGVHVHGKAGDLVAQRLSKPGLIAEDLPLAIAEVMR
jgi:NAD(P)H-hydrate epimerase